MAIINQESNVANKGGILRETATKESPGTLGGERGLFLSNDPHRQFLLVRSFLTPPLLPQIAASLLSAINPRSSRQTRAGWA